MWFQYPEELNKDSFRIFTLEPGEEKDGLHGSLQTHRLEAAPAYEALSYEWGKRSETRLMKCNNYDFKITQSLDVTLRRLRLTDKSRCLWIDQICINQESYDERSTQVSIMRLIYSNAAMVVAWLGPADTEAANSVKSLLAALKNLQEFSSEEKHFPDDDHLATLNLPRRNSRAWNDLNLMLDVSYFSRVWIIQELAVSSKFQLLWGNITISEDEYESLKHKIMFLSMTESDGKEGCPEIRWKSVPFGFLGKKKWDEEDLLELVQLASRSKATNQQDKIYALIGLAGQRHYNVQPDYSKPESEVFADFATRVIVTNENLHILDHAYVKDPSESTLRPFWAPRWQSEDSAARFVDGKYEASKDTKTIVGPSRAAGILELRGLEVDVVRDVHHRVLEVHQAIAAALDLVKSHNDPFEQTYKLDAIKVVILTMMAGREIDVFWVANLKRPKDESYLDDFITYAHIIMMQNEQPTGYNKSLNNLIDLALKARGPVSQHEPHIGDTSKEQAISGEIKRRYPDNPEYISRALNLFNIMQQSKENQGWYRFIEAATISKDLNFFITEKGYVGVGPRCMKAGDKACILFGGSTPYIIRPTSIPDECLYLGPAYVHGLMDGEVIDAWEKDKDSDNQKFQERLFKLL